MNEQLHDRRRRIIRVDGSIEIIERPVPNSEIRRLIGAPQGLDTVSLRHMGPPLMVMLVDDVSQAEGYPPRPVNPIATALYHANCRPGTTYEIRGDVAIVSDDDYAPPRGGYL